MVNKLFIIIVTYNGIHWIDKCLTSCANYNVVVVDNQSNDNTINYIKSNFPSVVVLEQSKNLGFGKANNVGLNYALKHGAEYFLLLNQDAYLKKDTISKLITEFNNNKDFAILSPIHLAGSETQIDLQFQSYLVPSSCRSFHNDMFLKNQVKNVYEVSFVNAAIWMLNKQTLKKIGGFNPYFFHYAEDNDYVNRSKFKGLKLGVVPNCFAIHDREQKFRKQSNLDVINYLKIKLMDPNQRKSVISIILLALRQSFKSLIKFDINTSKLYLDSVFKILKDSKKIKAIKVEVLNENFPFLNF